MCGSYECKLCSFPYHFCGADARISRTELKVFETYCGYCRKYLEKKRKIKLSSIVEPLPKELRKCMIEYSFRKRRHWCLGKVEREKEKGEEEDEDLKLARNLAQTSVFPPTLPLGKP